MMSHIEEFISQRSMHTADYNGKGGNLYAIWHTDTEIIRCRNCKKFETTDCAVYRALRAEERIEERGMFNPDGFCAWAERSDAE